MQPYKPSILSTRPLATSFQKKAEEAGIQLDAVSFIETHPIDSPGVIQQITKSLSKSSAVVFTSMNAVEVVAQNSKRHKPDWRIFSIGNTTRKLIEQHFGTEQIAGTANDASSLAENIIQTGNISEVIFFCGDQRRSELPLKLTKAGVKIEEIVVYTTIAIPFLVSKSYDAVLFYSPSAVESFFSLNSTKPGAILFAIGNTTASALRKYTTNTIIISEKPGKESLADLALNYFGNKTVHHHE